MTDRIQLNEDGSLDEVVAGGAHLEQMACIAREALK